MSIFNKGEEAKDYANSEEGYAGDEESNRPFGDTELGNRVGIAVVVLAIGLATAAVMSGLGFAVYLSNSGRPSVEQHAK